MAGEMAHVPETTSAAFPKQMLVQDRRAGAADPAHEDTRAAGRAQRSSRLHPGTSLRCFAGAEAPKQAF